MHAVASRFARVRALELSPAAFRRVSLAATLALWIVVATGAAVRLTGSGLGCEHWPGCTAGNPFPERGGDAEERPAEHDRGQEGKTVPAPKPLPDSPGRRRDDLLSAAEQRHDLVANAVGVHTGVEQDPRRDAAVLPCEPK